MPTYGNINFMTRIYAKYYYKTGPYILAKESYSSYSGMYTFRIVNATNEAATNEAAIIKAEISKLRVDELEILGEKKDFSKEMIRLLYGTKVWKIFFIEFIIEKVSVL